MKLGVLIGSGHRVMLLALPFLAVGLVLNILHPSWFSVGGPPLVLTVISIVILVPGVISGYGRCSDPDESAKSQLITSGPFSLVKHPLYTGVDFLVLPGLASCSTRAGSLGRNCHVRRVQAVRA